MSINESIANFWERQSNILYDRAYKHPEWIAAAVARMEHDMRTLGFRPTRSLEAYVEEQASFENKRAFKGGYAKGDAYLAARALVFDKHSLWLSDPVLWADINSFSRELAQLILSESGRLVKPSTVIKWLKQAKLRRPKRPKKKRIY